MSIKYILLLAAALTGMCLARYASVIFYIATFAIFIWYFVKKETVQAKSIFAALTIGSLGFGTYLFNNYLQCGYMTGMPRVNTQDFTAAELTGKFFMGIFNQLHIIKQFRFAGMQDVLFYAATASIQLALMAFTIFQLVTASKTKEVGQGNKLLMYLGSLYLVFLIYMTFTSTIDPFDYRTLLPFSFPLFIAVFSETEERLRINDRPKTIIAIKCFFVFSLLMNLPKNYLLGLIS